VQACHFLVAAVNFSNSSTKPAQLVSIQPATMAAAEALFSQKHEHGGHVAEASEKSEGLELHTFNNMTRVRSHERTRCILGDAQSTCCC
jgi:hypothetical protein